MSVGVVCKTVWGLTVLTTFPDLLIMVTVSIRGILSFVRLYDYGMYS
jgi:hypothetical protein